jgi:hypothetical protein
MDLNQRKLSKSEWDNIEIPVSMEEKEILELITRGYQEVNVKYNKHKSLFGYLKIDFTEEMEDHLFNKYFLSKLSEIKKKYKAFGDVLSTTVKSNPTIKKADIIRIEKNDPSKLNSGIIYELLLIDIIEKVVKYKSKESKKWLLHYFTLYKMIRNNVYGVNRHIVKIVQNLILEYEEELDMNVVIECSVEFIEKNQLLLKYADMTLYEHQKEIFTIVKQQRQSPKLILYTAPTGTGKTLTPIGLSEEYRVIFVCAARHVGLALAKSAISVGKKIAFGFGCNCSEDIRLHYFAAKEYKVNKKSGMISKVDNSVGDKVEIMICDVKSFLSAMYYMKSFNPVENIIVYWDEPTITMDYDTHDLHATIKQNWKENLIPNVILSSATLPKMHELSETIADFKEKFGMTAHVHNIVSNDCKKSIPIVNKNGYVVLPHYLSEHYSEILTIARHCSDNMTLLRYFDLNEVVSFISFVERNDYIKHALKIARCFTSLNEVTMQNIKTHYLTLLSNITSGTWGAVYMSMKTMRKKFIEPNTSVDPDGNRIKKSTSFGPGSSAYATVARTDLQGAPLMKMMSEQIVKPPLPKPDENCAIYVTTKDAYTLTDGPTIFLAEDIEKIARFCVQQANIPPVVMQHITEKIEFNNEVNAKIEILEHTLEDMESKSAMKNDSKSVSGSSKSDKKSSSSKKETSDKNVEFVTMNNELERLRNLIKPAELNETFIPNKQLHLKKWAESMELSNPFTSDIEESVVIDIMKIPDVSNTWKILLLMGIGVFANHTSITYTEIMKKLADQQKLYLIIASTDYIYGTNYQFCHGYLSKDLVLTQEKIIQSMGRIGRNNIQQNYSIRFRDDAQIQKLFYPEENKKEIVNMNLLFNSS